MDSSPVLVCRKRVVNLLFKADLHTATNGGNMIAIENANDFEFYSANSAGGIQGNGFQCRNAGCVSAFFH